MKNLHLIPTLKPSRLYKSKITQDISMGPIDIYQHGDATYNLTIYITSDEEIKEGDWVIYNNKVFKIGRGDNELFHLSKKIILTTDQDLIKDGVQSIDEEFLEWFVKNPSCEEVEVDYDVIVTQTKALLQNQDNKTIAIPHRIHYKIIISKEKQKQYIIDIMKADEELGLYEEPKQIKCYCGHTTYCDCSPQEEPKQETLEEAALNYSKQFLSTQEYDFKEGAKWQQERMYSKEDLRTAWMAAKNSSDFNEWFEQYKKK